MLRQVLLHSNGPALWPEHKPEEEVLALKDTTPERVWEATYQGNPVAPAGSIFRRSWWEGGKNRYEWTDHELRRRCIARWLSFDTALKVDSHNAYSTGMVFDLLSDYRVVLRDLWREKVEFTELTESITTLSRTHNQDGKLRGVVIEDKASGISAIQTIRANTELEWLAEILTAFTPTVDKETRAMLSSVWCRNGMVLIPHPGPEWLYDFENELFAFPNSTYADQVDAFSQGIIFLEHLLAEGFQLRAGNRETLLKSGDAHGVEYAS